VHPAHLVARRSQHRIYNRTAERGETTKRKWRFGAVELPPALKVPLGNGPPNFRAWCALPHLGVILGSGNGSASRLAANSIRLIWHR